MSDTGKKFIDIEGVIRQKNANLVKLMPAFIMQYLKRILHQDEINSFIEKQGHNESFAFIHEILKEFGATVQYKGLENVPQEGGCILASNHPLGGLDALALIDTVAKKRKDQKFVVNDVLLQIKNLESIFVGVNKHGKNTSSILEQIDQLYGSGTVMIIFPAGLVSRKKKGIIKDLEWKKSFITKARKHQKNIIPVYINGRNTDFFYNFANARTMLGIRSNIEMFYLVNEMYKQKGNSIEITFGKPVSYQLFTNTRSDAEWAQLMRDHIYKLQNNPIAIFSAE